MERTLNAPTFFVLGAAKSGTTSLYRYLADHPQVCMSQPKEPHFFELEYEKGLAYYWSTYFNHYNGEPAAGEKRHRNLFLPYVPKRIKTTLPNAKLVAILRNPIERAFSHWWHRTFHEENLPFEQAIKQNLVRIENGIDFSGVKGPSQWANGFNLANMTNQYRTYLDTGYYDEQLERYLSLFPRNQMKILLLEDLRTNPGHVMKGLHEFLGLDPNTNSSKYTAQNMAKTPGADSLIKFGVNLHLNRVIPPAGRMAIKKNIKKFFPNRPKLKGETREFLINHFRPHILRTEELIERDLSHWLK